MARKTVKRRKSARVRGLNAKDAGSFLTQQVLPGAAGAVLVSWVVDKFLPIEYAPYRNYVIGGLGLGAAIAMKNPIVKAVGAGAALYATTNIGQDLLDGQAPGLGLLRPGVPGYRISEQRAELDVNIV